MHPYRTSSGTRPQQLPVPAGWHVCHFVQPEGGNDTSAVLAVHTKEGKRLRRSIRFVVVPVYAQVALVDIVPGHSRPAGRELHALPLHSRKVLGG